MTRYGWVMGKTRWCDETGVSHLLVTPSNDGQGPVKLACGNTGYHGQLEHEARGTKCKKCLRALPFYTPAMYGVTS